MIFKKTAQDSENINLVPDEDTDKKTEEPKTEEKKDIYEAIDNVLKNTDLAKQMGENEQLVKIWKTNYDAMNQVIDTRIRASFSDQLDITDNPCGIKLAEDVVVSPEEAMQAINQFFTSANKYREALRKKLNFFEQAEQSKQQAESKDPVFQKNYASDNTIEEQIAKVNQTIQETDTTIEIDVRRRRIFMALLPIKEQYLDLMLDTCSWEKQAEKTEKILGFKNNEQIQNLEMCYNQAIELLKQYKQQYAAVNPVNSGKRGKLIDNIITSFEMKKNDLYMQNFKRLFPGFGTPAK